MRQLSSNLWSPLFTNSFEFEWCVCLSSAAKEDILSILSTCHLGQNTNLYSLMAFARGQLRTYFFESVW